MKLEFVQKFIGGGVLLPPSCDHCVTSRAIAMWQDKEHKAYCLCSSCAMTAEADPIIEGAWYVPTNSPLSGYSFKGGQYQKWAKS